MLDQIRRFRTDDVTTELENLVAMHVHGSHVVAGFSEHTLEAPEWLIRQLSLIKREIARRNEDNLRQKLQAAKSKRAALLTPDEKRSQLDKEIAELSAALGAGV